MTYWIVYHMYIIIILCWVKYVDTMFNRDTIQTTLVSNTYFHSIIVKLRNNNGSHNMLWVLTWVGSILVFYPEVK